jgi:hypothetical protein
MARDVISTCPVCEGELAITRLHCRSCGTALEGEFGVGRFGRLSREQLSLLESFLRSRGNLKDLERELGISYPTVRGRIEALLRALGLADGDEPVAVDEASQADAPNPTADEDAIERRAILDRLARREISAEDAAEALRTLGGA